MPSSKESIPVSHKTPIRNLYYKGETPIGGSAPKAPSPYEQANAQKGATAEAAYASGELNAIPQYSPYGSITYDYTQKQVPQYDSRGNIVGYTSYNLPSGQHTTLAPQYQALLDQQTANATALGSKSAELLGQIPTTPFDPNDPKFDTSNIAKTLYDRQYGLLKPQIEEQQNAMGVSLSDRGIPIGSEVWNNEQNRFQGGVGRQLDQLTQDATLAASNEQQRLLSNALQQRGLPFQEYAALSGAIPNVQTPQAAPLPATNIQAPNIADYMSQNYANQLNSYNTSQANTGAIAGGLAAMLPMLMMFSDERLKKDKTPIEGESVLKGLRDVPISEWEYTEDAQNALGVPGGRRVGPMAQDVHKKFGGASPSLIDLGDMLGRTVAAVKALDMRTQNLKGTHAHG